MKKTGAASWGICLLRISASLVMFYGHGWPKFMKFISGNPVEFADPLGIGSALSFMLVLFAEFFCSILILIGFMTRLCAIPVIIAMSVASFIQHSGDAFRQKELALMYLVIYLTLFLTGPGAFSLQAGLGIKPKGSGVKKFLLG